MKRLGLVYGAMVLGFGIFYGQLLADQNSPQSSQSGVLELHSEKQYPEKAKLVLVAPSTDTNEPLKTKVRVTDKAVQIFDESENVKREIRLENNPTTQTQTKVYPARRGDYIGLHTTRGLRPQSESWESSDYVVLDKEGNEKLRLHNPSGALIIPSPTGNYAIGLLSVEAPGGPPLFYDANGLRNKWVKGFGGDNWPSGYVSQSASFSSDGSHVAVTAVIGQKFKLFYYDAYGDELWRQDSAANAVFSPSGKSILYECNVDYEVPKYDICLADSSGHRLWAIKKEGIGGGNAFWSADESKVCITTGFQSLKVIDTKTGTILWQWNANIQPLPDRNSALRLGLISGNSDLSMIVATGYERKEIQFGKPEGFEDQVYVFSKGNLMRELHFLYGAILEVQLTQDGDWMNVSLQDKAIRYRIKH